MSSDDQISDDPGTILDSYADLASLRKAAHVDASDGPASPVVKPTHAASGEEVIYRSPYRPVAPRLMICNDGSLEEGELVYVRSDRIVIGRMKGEVVIPNDVAMSASHAEIVRTDVRGKHGWRLRDLGSSNGTFARCRSVTLKPGMLVLIGSKRYRFDVPEGGADHDDQKTPVVHGLVGEDALPALVELPSGNAAVPVRFPFRSLRVNIGRPGANNAIELDDLCVAKLHAVVTRDTSGDWHMQSQPSLNGIWAQIDAVTLTDGCLFQCGEQQFRFLI